MTPGSHERAAEVVADALLRAGATNLETKVGATSASYGDNCWLTDRALGEHIRRSDGRKFHKGSIGRARRKLVKRGFMKSTRVYPSGRLPSGMRSSQGTTIKSVCWKAIGKRCPMNRPAKRAARARQILLSSDAPPSTSPNARTRSKSNVEVPAELLAMLSRVGASPVTSVRLPMHSSHFATPNSTATTGQSAASMTPAEAKARLAAWELEQKERGPP